MKIGENERKCYLCKVLIGPQRVYKRVYKRFNKPFCKECRDQLDSHKRPKTWLINELSKYGVDEEVEWSPLDILFVDICSEIQKDDVHGGSH